MRNIKYLIISERPFKNQLKSYPNEEQGNGGSNGNCAEAEQLSDSATLTVAAHEIVLAKMLMTFRTFFDVLTTKDDGPERTLF